MHVRVPAGARIEETAAEFDRIGREIRALVPADELGSITDNIGLPVSSINAVYNNSGTLGPQDGRHPDRAQAWPPPDRRDRRRAPP